MAGNMVVLRELKARVGRYLKSVRTERKLARLRAEGRIGGGNGRLKPHDPIHAPGVSLSEAIIEDREDRF